MSRNTKGINRAKEKNRRALTNSGKQRGQDQNHTNTTLKTNKKFPAGHPPCCSCQIGFEEGREINGTIPLSFGTQFFKNAS